MNSVPRKLLHPVSVIDNETAEEARSRVDNPNSIWVMHIVTDDMPANKLVKITKVLTEDFSLYSFSMQPYHIGSPKKDGKVTRYYAIDVASTSEELDKIEDKMSSLLEKERTTAEHNKFIDSTLSVPLS